MAVQVEKNLKIKGKGILRSVTELGFEIEDPKTANLDLILFKDIADMIDTDVVFNISNVNLKKKNNDNNIDDGDDE